MELKGTVLNVVDFGAFVDIGLKDSGLVHISQLANRYIKSPHDVVSVGDVVSVWVMGVDGERKRVSLTMVKPGTERPRGERASGGGGGGGGGRRQQGEGEGRGGERRQGGGAPRGPRREPIAPSNLTAPPVGTPAGSQGPGSGEGTPPPQRRPEPPRTGGRESNFRPASGGGQGRGGPRPGGFGGGQGGGGGGGGRSGPPGRFEPRPPAPMLPPKPAKPAPPPPPLSKEAVAGRVPLRSFGQLKQLFDTTTPTTEGSGGGEGGGAETPPASPPESTEG